jgi:predicted ABC-type exoprotein transport system permease subunit
MKNANHHFGIILIPLTFLINSCKSVAGYFKAGVGYGFFVAMAVSVLIIGIVMKVRKK